MGKKAGEMTNACGVCPFLADKSWGVPKGEPGGAKTLCMEGAEEEMRLAIFFKRKRERDRWKKRFCNAKFEDCPYYWIASGKYEE